MPEPTTVERLERISSIISLIDSQFGPIRYIPGPQQKFFKNLHSFNEVLDRAIKSARDGIALGEAEDLMREISGILADGILGLIFMEGGAKLGMLAGAALSGPAAPGGAAGGAILGGAIGWGFSEFLDARGVDDAFAAVIYDLLLDSVNSGQPFSLDDIIEYAKETIVDPAAEEFKQFLKDIFLGTLEELPPSEDLWEPSVDLNLPDWYEYMDTRAFRVEINGRVYVGQVYWESETAPTEGYDGPDGVRTVPEIVVFGTRSLFFNPSTGQLEDAKGNPIDLTKPNLRIIRREPNEGDPELNTAPEVVIDGNKGRNWVGPDGVITYSQLGSIFGSNLSRLIETNDPMADLAISTFIGTLASNIGQALDLGGDLGDAFETAFSDFDADLLDAGVGAISSYLFGELINSLGIDGVAGRALSTIGGAAISQIATNLTKLGELTVVNGELTVVKWDTGVTTALGNAAGSFLGTWLASELVQFDTVAGQIGASIGSSIGSIVAGKLLGQSISSMLGQLSWLGGPIAAAIGAFVGYILGGLIGSLFGGTPEAGADIGWDTSTGKLKIAKVWSKHDGDSGAARSLATSALDTIDAVLSASGSSILNADTVKLGAFGLKGEKLFYKVKGTSGTAGSNFSTKKASELVNHGTYHLLSQIYTRMGGGDIYLKRALSSTIELAGGTPGSNAAHSEGDFNIETLMANISAAQDYVFYLQNREFIDHIILNEPTTALAISWMATLALALDLGLDRRAASDWTGGWNLFLDEMRDGAIDGRSVSPGSMILYLDEEYNFERTFAAWRSKDHPILVYGDTISRGSKDMISAGSSNDVVTVAGDIIGSTTGLTINGAAPTASSFKIDVSALINAGGGNDTVRVGDLGNDALGGDGNDTLVGGKLDDWLFGEGGNDILFAGNVSNITFGATDTAAQDLALAVDGGSGNFLDGGDGDDRIYGSKGSDWLAGGAGVDLLVGGAGGDILDGGEGNDRGSSGEARLLGGAGSDQYIFGYGSGQDVVFDDAGVDAGVADITYRIGQIAADDDKANWAGGGDYEVDGSVVGGEDAIAFGIGITLQHLIIRRSGDDLIVELVAVDADGEILYNGAGEPLLSGDQLTVKNWFVNANRIEWLRFADGDDFRISDITTYIIGTGASDTIIGTSGRDFIYGSGGNDIVHALAGMDYVAGGRGSDMLSGDADNDLVVGGAEHDQVSGGGGNDTLTGDKGDDVVYGGAGSDIMSGGEGDDVIAGGAGDDVTLYKRGDGRDTLLDEYAGSWEVAILATGLPNTALGYATGTGGVITKGGVVIYDGTRWIGSYRYNDLTGETERWVEPTSGAKVVDSGEDVLEFGIGIDIQDLVLQQSVNDLRIGVSTVNGTAAFEDIADQIRILDWYAGGTAGKSIETFVFAAVGSITLSYSNAMLGYQLIGGTDGADTINAGNGMSWATGGAGDDVITGSGLLNGGAGDDKIHAGYGFLYGGAGDDTLYINSPAYLTAGGATLYAVTRVWGGDGFDVVSFADMAGGVTAFAYGGYSRAAAFMTGVVTEMGEDLREIEGLEGSNYADNLHGSINDDMLRGGVGADNLRGNEGDDVYEFSRGDGADTVADGALDFVSIEYWDTTKYSTTFEMEPAGTYGDRYRYHQKITEIATGAVLFDRTFDYNKTSAYLGLTSPPSYGWPNWNVPVHIASAGGWLASMDAYATGMPVDLSGLAIPYASRVVAATGDGGDDTISFGADIGLQDLTFTRPVGTDDLVISIVGTTDSITIKDQFTSSGVNADRAVETLQFADGLAVDLTTLRFTSSGTSGADLLVGTATADTLSGGAGHDVLSGASGNDTLSGGDGDDVMEGGAGNDSFDGGTDSQTAGLAPDGSANWGDTIRYVRSGAAVSVDLATRTLSGGDAAGDSIVGATIGGVANTSTIENVTGSDGYGDTLKGDHRGNRLNGMGGADTIEGRAGDDVIAGGKGVDTLSGGDGDDAIAGEADNDGIHGDAGNDLVSGGDGIDTIYGDGGNDRLGGDAGNDTISGGDGKDTIGGGDGDDILAGDAGDDVISGGLGGDTLTGGVGNDVLSGDAGNDSLQGGAGNDTYVFDAASGSDTILDAEGLNEIAISGVDFSRVWLTRSGANLKIGIIGGDATITVTNYFATTSPSLIHAITVGTHSLLMAGAGALITAMTTASATTPTSMSEAMADQTAEYWTVGAHGAPTASDTSISIQANATASGVFGASDPDGDIPATGAYAVETQGALGSVSVANNGEWTYTPTADASGSDSFVLRVTDAAGHFTLKTVSVAIAAPPAAPTASVTAATLGETTSSVLTTVSNLTAAQGSGSTFKISGDSLGWFEISGTQLKLKAGLNLDFETLAALSNPALTLVDSDSDGLMEVAYTVQVRSQKDGTTSLGRAITYRIEDVNEAPTFTSLSFSNIVEGVAGPTVLGTAVATDPDTHSGNADVRYSLTGADASSFTINATTGQLTFNGTANYETKSVYSINVVARDRAGVGAYLSATQAVTVNVTDVNEAPTASNQTFTIAENLAPGATVGTFAFLDADTAVANRTHVYSLSGTDAAAFSISSTGVITANASLNYEAKSSYSLDVTVRDQGGSGLSVTRTVTVNVTDANDAPTANDQTFTIAESLAPNGTVGTFVFNDVDVLTANRNHIYALSGADAAAFTIGTTGIIKVVASPNYEAKSSYTFDVTVTDKSGSGLSVTRTVTVNVTDVNEAPTASDQTFTLAENLAAGATVGTFVYSDPDTLPANLNPVFSLSGTDAAAFTISSTGVITANASLNYEAKSTYSFNVTVRDQGGSGLSVTKAVTVNVTDANDAPTASNQTFTLAENLAAGATVGIFAYGDADTLPANLNPVFSLSGTDAAAFSISSTGVITANASLNYEAKPSYSFDVMVRDQGGSGLSVTRTVTVNVSNVNEAPIVAPQTFSVSENPVSTLAVGTVVSTDPDAGALNHRYSLSGGDAAAFVINSTTGAITVSGAIDYETKSSYSFTVNVTDLSGTGLTTSGTITVNIVDAPAATFNQTVSIISEGTIALTTFGQIVNQQGGTPTYNEVSDPLNLITLSNANVRISAGTYDFETLAASTPDTYWTLSDSDGDGLMEFAYRYQARTRVNNIYSDPVDIWIRIEDVNEAPTASDQTFGVDENSATGATVGTVAFADADTQTSTRDHRFSISGADAAKFLINATTGVITVNGALDYETKATYSFNVTITDRGGTGLSVTRVVTVNLADIYESPPAPTVSQVETFRNESTTATTALTIANLTSNQTGGAATFSEVSDPWDWFEISGSELKLRAGLVFDFDTLAASTPGAHWSIEDSDSDGLMEIAYRATVKSTVAGIDSDVSNAIIYRVEDVNEAPTISGASWTVSESLAIGASLGTPSWSDPDSYDSPRFSLSGADAAKFAINETTGEITLAAGLDYETKSSYSFTVTVRDRAGTGATASNTVNVTVQDANDAPTIPAGQVFSVNENVGSGTTVGAVVASDSDALATNRNIRYAISGADASMFQIHVGTGNITAKNGLNYEAKSSYTFTVTVTDQTGAGLSTSQDVTVNINDVNDAPTLGAKAMSVDENSAIGTYINTASTMLADADTLAINRGHRYSLTGTDAAAFTIDAVTGDLYLAVVPDRETQSTYAINIVVTDQLGTGLSATRAVTVTINDVNEAPVVAAQSFSIAEDVASGAAVGTVVWSDPDTASGNRNPRFSISGPDAAKFNIHSTTGVISTVGTLDYETKSSYSLTVQVRDKGGTGLIASETITINVTDVSEGGMPPVVLDLDGDGLDLVAIAASDTTFDADGDGLRERVGWVGADDGLLALDRDGDGVIDGRSEISFVDDKAGAVSDLEGLAAFDTDGDGRLDADDARFADFRVWRDLNQDGVGQTNELLGLTEAGIDWVGLGLQRTGAAAEAAVDNVIYATSSFGRRDGTTGVVGDVFLAFDGATSTITTSSATDPEVIARKPGERANGPNSINLNAYQALGVEFASSMTDLERILAASASPTQDTRSTAIPLAGDVAQATGSTPTPAGADTGDLAPGAVDRRAGSGRKNSSAAQTMRNAIGGWKEAAANAGNRPAFDQDVDGTRRSRVADPYAQPLGAWRTDSAPEAADYDFAAAADAASPLQRGLTLAEKNRFKIVQAMASFAPEASAEFDARNGKLHDPKAMELLTALPQQKAFG